jgi:hypothetical protein
VAAPDQLIDQIGNGITQASQCQGVRLNFGHTRLLVWMMVDLTGPIPPFKRENSGCVKKIGNLFY